MPPVPKLLGYAILLAALPLAVLGLLATSNEYRAMGVDALDCDGPISVLIFAIPALVVYGIAGSIFLYQSSNRRSLIPVVICGLICLGLIWNIGNAFQEQWENGSACDSVQ